MRNAVIPLSLALLLGACSSTIDRGAMQSSMEQDGLFTTDLTVAQLQGLRPQVRIPFRLGIAPPSGGRYVSPWSGDEAEKIESWGQTLKGEGIISDLVLIPRLTVGDTGDTVKSQMQAFRRAAARQNVDAVLITRVVSDYSSWSNPLSILDLTIVGMWIVPGHSAEAVTLIEGAVVDVRNEYLYGSGQVEGSEKITRPLQYIERDHVTRAARLDAMDALGDLLIEKTRAAVVQAASRRN